MRLHHRGALGPIKLNATHLLEVLVDSLIYQKRVVAG